MWGAEYFCFPEKLFDAIRLFCEVKFKQHLKGDFFNSKFKMTLDNGRKVHAAQMRVRKL